jgi:hypothetical protein
VALNPVSKAAFFSLENSTAHLWALDQVGVSVCYTAMAALLGLIANHVSFKSFFPSKNFFVCE